MATMTEQLNVGQLIAALDGMDRCAPVLIAGFGIANGPGDIVRHRSHLNDVAIEVIPQRIETMTVERLRTMLYQHASQSVSQGNPDPATMDSPAWIRPRKESEQSFFAVTSVDSFSDRAVIRGENVAPIQGPTIQRISDDEVLRRNAEVTGFSSERHDPEVASKMNRWLLRSIASERSKVKFGLETALAELAQLQQEIPRLEAETERIDYILGITDVRPESVEPSTIRP